MNDKLTCPRCKTVNYFYKANKNIKCYNCYLSWINPQTTFTDFEV